MWHEGSRRFSQFLSGVRHAGYLLVLLGMILGLVGCGTKPQEEPPTPISLEPSIQGELEPVHPDEPVEHTFNTRFSLQNALAGITRVRETAEKPEGEAGMAFTNALGSLEGTLRKQEYELKKLEFELAKYQHRDGQITKEQLDQTESAYRDAAQDFRAFWSTFGISD